MRRKSAFSLADVVPYWIDTSGLPETADGGLPRLAIVPCPPGGELLGPAVRFLRSQGIGTLVSLLRADEARAMRLEAEGRACREAGIEFRWLPVVDHSVPESAEEFALLVEELRRELRAGRAVGAHCYAGIGRSCTLMGGLLCREGLTPEEAFQRLSAARGLRVPESWLQVEWVERFAASLRQNGHRENFVEENSFPERNRG